MRINGFIPSYEYKGKLHMSIIVQEMGLSNTHYGMESADTIEMDFLTDTAELDSLSNDLDTAHDAMASMESLTQVEGVPGPVLLVAAENMLAHMGFHGDAGIPSMESEADTTYGMEKLGDFIKKIWEAIKSAFKKVWGAISGFFKKLFGVKEKVAKKAKENVDVIDKALKEDPKATVMVSKVDLANMKDIKPGKPVDMSPMVKVLEEAVDAVAKGKDADVKDVVSAVEKEERETAEMEAEFKNIARLKRVEDSNQNDEAIMARVSLKELKKYAESALDEAETALRYDSYKDLTMLKDAHDTLERAIAKLGPEDKAQVPKFTKMAKIISVTMVNLRTRESLNVNTSKRYVSTIHRTIANMHKRIVAAKSDL